jgi:hypothetical protein
VAIQPPVPPTPPPPKKGAVTENDIIIDYLYNIEVRIYKLQMNQLMLFKMLRK